MTFSQSDEQPVNLFRLQIFEDQHAGILDQLFARFVIEILSDIRLFLVATSDTPLLFLSPV